MMPHSLLYKYTHSYMRQGNYCQALRGKARLFLMLLLGTQEEAGERRGQASVTSYNSPLTWLKAVVLV